MKIVVCLEGGLVQEVYVDFPMVDPVVEVIDTDKYDEDRADKLARWDVVARDLTNIY
jgi:hypothetical protein